MSTESDGASGQDDFRSGMIRPTLLSQLQKILDRYPDDNQIIKVGATPLLAVYREQNPDLLFAIQRNSFKTRRTPERVK